MEEAYETCGESPKKFGKPMLNTETACIARATRTMCCWKYLEQHKTGWYVFNLIIQGYWGEVHGLFFPTARFATRRSFRQSWASIEIAIWTR